MGVVIGAYNIIQVLTHDFVIGQGCNSQACVASVGKGCSVVVEYGSGIAVSVGQARVGGQGLDEPESFCVCGPCSI